MTATVSSVAPACRVQLNVLLEGGLEVILSGCVDDRAVEHLESLLDCVSSSGSGVRILADDVEWVAPNAMSLLFDVIQRRLPRESVTLAAASDAVLDALTGS